MIRGRVARVERRWAFSLAWINASVTVVVLILAAANSVSGFRELFRIWAYSMVYANLTGIPAVWLLPGVLEKLAQRKFPLAPAVVLGAILFAAAGCLGVQSLATLLGLVVPQHFWQEYFHTLRLSALLATVFGFGAFFHGAMRERMRKIEAQLHQKQVTEERTRKLAAEARLRSLESRIHPHFLFNTLNSISALAAVDSVRCEQTIGRLAALLRSSLDTTNQPLIPLRQELAMLEDYIDIEKMRFGGKLEGRVQVLDDLWDVKVPPLSIQSLVENAVKHGITPQRGGGEFLVSASEENGMMRIEVSDSGPGFDLAAIQAGHGLDNLVERLHALFGSQAHLRVLRRDGRCVVEMVLPRS